ncbi:hypothetical protein BELL_0080g00130 [Botrytis elliptica]|uniref:Uncharacterized protein n=1 Tax=Botrytis elliptica TaxID=278938 RepID=A0A4Z1JXZ2_9HELO|nr:hypothetical protein EAE99_007328 [Botrytis elliptica]TGO78064.1 hypothetical protein BELL_0080g00130 [Botrytis elliptica]
MPILFGKKIDNPSITEGWFVNATIHESYRSDSNENACANTFDTKTDYSAHDDLWGLAICVFFPIVPGTELRDHHSGILTKSPDQDAWLNKVAIETPTEHEDQI